MTDPTQASAARLTAIAEQACNGTKSAGQVEYEIEELIAAQIDTLRQDRDAARAALDALKDRLTIDERGTITLKAGR